MTLLSRMAPVGSRLRLALSIARDALRRPSSFTARLSQTNKANARLCATLRIHCNVCGTDGGMFYDYPDVELRRAHGIGLLRETLNCRSCGATMRDRQIAHGILGYFADGAGMGAADLVAWRAHETRAPVVVDTDSFSAINRVLRGMPGYLHTQYKPELPNGQRLPDGSINADLLELPFASASVDVLLTSDVMEHVANDEQAHREIHRCLKPGGAYVFTVPFDPTLAATRPLTLPSDAARNATPFVLEHHVHGDPHSGTGIVAHRIYGQSLISELASIGFDTRFLPLQEPVSGIYGGDLFVATRTVS